MKIVFAGAWQYEMYEAAFARALTNLGVSVEQFDLFKEQNGLLARFEQKYSCFGPHSWKSQTRLISVCRQHCPDIVFIWLGAGVLGKNLKRIKEENNTLVVGYVHDDPFAHQAHDLSPRHHWIHWRPFIKALPYYDLVLFSKQLTVDTALALGAKNAGVLLQYFVPWIHRSIELGVNEKSQFDCDIAFAGHYEADGREDALLALAKVGLRVNLYQGGLWDRSRRINQTGMFHGLKCLPSVRGDDYTKALGAASMCLCFMSKMNRDSYTTRCFEIPACSSLLLSERTPDLQRLFREDEEAVFFSTKEELVKKALWLRDNPEIRDRIAAAGLRRVHKDGHSVQDRARQFLSMVEQIRNAGGLT